MPVQWSRKATVKAAPVANAPAPQTNPPPGGSGKPPRTPRTPRVPKPKK